MKTKIKEIIDDARPYISWAFLPFLIILVPFLLWAGMWSLLLYEDTYKNREVFGFIVGLPYVFVYAIFYHGRVFIYLYWGLLFAHYLCNPKNHKPKPEEIEENVPLHSIIWRAPIYLFLVQAVNITVLDFHTQTTLLILEWVTCISIIIIIYFYKNIEGQNQWVFPFILIAILYNPLLNSNFLFLIILLQADYTISESLDICLLIGSALIFIQHYRLYGKYPVYLKKTAQIE